MNSQALEAVHELLAMATGADACPRCHGEGELAFNASPDGDPQMDDHTPCPRCYGTGELTP